MRVISFALVFSSVLGLVAGAVPHRRSTDTCANINLDIQLLIVVVKFGACLCLGGVDNAVATNPTLQLPVLTLGAPAVKKMLIDAINSGKDKSSCTYPDHCIPECSGGDLCGYHCPPDRIKQNGQCVCRPGTIECNGKCTTKTCSSQGINPRDMKDWIKSKRGVFCPYGTEMCSVPGSLGGWECVHTKDDLESCGGCAFPYFLDQKPGVDCSALPGVHTVACVQGTCRVGKCKSKWNLTEDGRACESSF